MDDELLPPDPPQHITMRDLWLQSARLDMKVDRIQSRLDRMDGAFSIVKWLGPTGLGAVILSLVGAGPVR